MVKKKEKNVKISTKSNKTPLKRTTAIDVWNPFEILDNFDRFFMEDPWTPSWWRQRRPLTPWLGQWLEQDTKISPLDLVDTGDKYKIIAEVPGVLKNDLEVNITENSINICGETKTDTKEEDEGYVRHERSYSTICRNMRFPEEVNPNNAEATLKDGILEVQVSKKTPTKSKGRKIPVK